MEPAEFALGLTRVRNISHGHLCSTKTMESGARYPTQSRSGRRRRGLALGLGHGRENVREVFGDSAGMWRSTAAADRFWMFYVSSQEAERQQRRRRNRRQWYLENAMMNDVGDSAAEPTPVVMVTSAPDVSVVAYDSDTTATSFEDDFSGTSTRHGAPHSEPRSVSHAHNRSLLASSHNNHMANNRVSHLCTRRLLLRPLAMLLAGYAFLTLVELHPCQYYHFPTSSSSSSSSSSTTSLANTTDDHHKTLYCRIDMGTDPGKDSKLWPSSAFSSFRFSRYMSHHLFITNHKRHRQHKTDDELVVVLDEGKYKKKSTEIMALPNSIPTLPTSTTTGATNTAEAPKSTPSADTATAEVFPDTLSTPSALQPPQQDDGNSDDASDDSNDPQNYGWEPLSYPNPIQDPIRCGIAYLGSASSDHKDARNANSNLTPTIATPPPGPMLQPNNNNNNITGTTNATIYASNAVNNTDNHSQERQQNFINHPWNSSITANMLLCDPDWVLGGLYLEEIALALFNFSDRYGKPPAVSSSDSSSKSSSPSSSQQSLAWDLFHRQLRATPATTQTDAQAPTSIIASMSTPHPLFLRRQLQGDIITEPPGKKSSSSPSSSSTDQEIILDIEPSSKDKDSSSNPSPVTHHSKVITQRPTVEVAVATVRKVSVLSTLSPLFQHLSSCQILNSNYSREYFYYYYYVFCMNVNVFR